MMLRTLAIVLLAGAAAAGCGSDRADDETADAPRPAAEGAPQHAAHDTAADPHAGHGAAADPHADHDMASAGAHGDPAPDAHAGHAAGGAAAAGHAGHAAGTAPAAGHAGHGGQQAGHAGHAAPATGQQHAGHTVQAPGQQHAGHVQAPAAGTPEAHGQHAHQPAATASDTAGAAALGLLMAALLEDPAVRARVEADAELRAAWSESAVRTHVTRPPPLGGETAAGMAGVYQLVRLLLELPTVQARIEADTVLLQLWSDPAVRQQIRHGGHQ